MVIFLYVLLPFWIFIKNKKIYFRNQNPQSLEMVDKKRMRDMTCTRAIGLARRRNGMYIETLIWIEISTLDDKYTFHVSIN